MVWVMNSGIPNPASDMAMVVTASGVLERGPENICLDGARVFTKPSQQTKFEHLSEAIGSANRKNSSHDRLRNTIDILRG